MAGVEATTIAALLGSNVVTAFITGALTRRTESEQFLLDQVKTAWSELHRLRAECEARERMQSDRNEKLAKAYDQLQCEYEELRREYDEIRHRIEISSEPAKI